MPKQCLSNFSWVSYEGLLWAWIIIAYIWTSQKPQSKSKYFTIFREEATSALAGFHVGPLSLSKWNLECWFLWREENRRTQASALTTAPSLLWVMALVCRRYNALTYWPIVTDIEGHYSPVMPTGRLRACARTIRCKVVTSAALALPFFCFIFVCHIINNLLTSAAGLTDSEVNTVRRQCKIFP